MKKTILSLVLVASSIFHLNAQNLAEFGSSASNLFTLDNTAYAGTWNSSTTTQTSSGITETGNDTGGNGFGGFWATPWTLSSFAGISVNITGTTNPGTDFTVTFFEETSFTQHAFIGNLSQPDVVGNNYSLTYQGAGTAPVSIIGATYTAGGVGSPQNISVNAVIPEPSTYALMALGGLVLFFIARRRKAQA
jgi:hypothetical protein